MKITILTKKAASSAARKLKLGYVPLQDWEDICQSAALGAVQAQQKNRDER